MEASVPDDKDKLKSRFFSAWNNMKYSWVLKTKTYFTRRSPVFLLGKCYHFKFEELSESSPEGSDSGSFASDENFGNVEDFRKDFISRIWLTYREGFPPLEESTWKTDCGWGCTLRTGQMLLAQGLLLHFLGRDWIWPNALDTDNAEPFSWSSGMSVQHSASIDTTSSTDKQVSPCKQPNKNCHKSTTALRHRNIISWFGDSPAAYFGLHKLVHLGKDSGKVAGDWYGPAVVSHIMRRAMEEASDPELKEISIYVAQDCTIYTGDVYEQINNADGEKAILILIPVRLGGERTNTEYFEFVKCILCLEYCVGIIGGRPKQSYYFIGFQDDSLIYMDPHYCQSFVDVSITDFPLESFHCPSPKKMTFKKMDPSCTIGFYCRNSKEFQKATEELEKVLKSSSRPNHSLFTFVNGHAQDFEFVCSRDHKQSDRNVEEDQERMQRYDSEEFVLL
uniref:Cysteine protease n=1 Tax=Leptobrachium leishanense TaxID=445787 RepID=A0A8C5PLU7_9ANUR